MRLSGQGAELHFLGYPIMPTSSSRLECYSCSRSWIVISRCLTRSCFGIPLLADRGGLSVFQRFFASQGAGEGFLE